MPQVTPRKGWIRQTNPRTEDVQEILPTFSRADVFGGGFYKHVFKSRTGFYEHDCATQCIIRILVSGFPHLPHLPYEVVADALQSKKCVEHAESEWTTEKTEEWMNHHISPTRISILNTIIELTGVDWEMGKPVENKQTLREYAWRYRKVPVMAVSTTRHIVAVINGLIYDAWDSRDKIVSCVMFPA